MVWVTASAAQIAGILLAIREGLNFDVND